MCCICYINLIGDSLSIATNDVRFRDVCMKVTAMILWYKKPHS